MALRGLRSRRYARKPTPRELYHGNVPCLTLGPSVGFSNPSTTLNSRELDGLASPSNENLNPLARLGSSAPLSADFASNTCPELLSGNSDVAMPRKRRKVSSIYSHAILQPIHVSVPPTSSNLWPIISEGRVRLPSRREFV